ncbi:MAG: hypothetical protein ACK5AZ_06470 [Bryobacteraceae bacterium]
MPERDETTGQAPEKYERTDANLRAILWFAGALVGSVVVIQYLLFGFYVLLDRATPEPVLSPLAPPRELPPQPRLQVSPALDMETYRQQEEAILEGYSLAPHEMDRYRIPIERAKDLLLERGLPVREQAPPRGKTNQGGKRAPPRP